ncbi:MAG: Xaa-Pro peptidase family protein [Ardenticatenaceae bacterium]|nr:Xaa-Pro peptidase family protein [Ardenticatenaceae bacterium]HBY98457.1 aminopeptidase P family protein [Chloroflexota bacterium]
MQQDLDHLMAERNLDALVVIIDEKPSANSLYLTRAAELSGGYVVKPRGRSPILYHHAIEAGGAAQSGLETRSLANFNLRQLIIEANNDRLQAQTRLIDLLLNDAGVSGRISMYGTTEIGRAFAWLSALAASQPEVEIVGEFHRDVLTVARETKDEHEIAAIRDVGRRTQEVMAVVVDFLRHQHAREGMLVDEVGVPITVGDIKRLIRRELLDRGLLDTEGTIFAIGLDAAIPHNSGKPDDPLRLGQPIVFDIFPRDLRTGYYFDMTRTFALGHAPLALQAMYGDVLDAFNAALIALHPEIPTADLQTLVCDLFEARDYPTPRTDPTSDVGYIHSLGHGIGLDVHEAPSLSDLSAEILSPGAVFTIEPGLYDPHAGLGVRIEDTVAIAPDGTVQSLTDFPKDLVIPVYGA